MAGTRPKNIILSSDGTGNAGGRKYDSNVWRLHTAIERQKHKDNPDELKQVAYYHDGVGTDDNKIWRIMGGAVGIGLDRIIKDLYIFLVNNYEPGDRVYLFGFSRGAYTVRLLAGMITTFGIIKKSDFTHQSDQDLQQVVNALFEKYKDKQKAKKIDSSPDSYRHLRTLADFFHFLLQPDMQPDHILQSYSAHEDSQQIAFIGVWDTVDAYGIPSDRLARAFDAVINTSFRNHDRTLCDKVLIARHALSIDDQRRVFIPVLWEETYANDHDRIQQVWFAGVHANVGGGYPKQGMAWTSLVWMMAEAEKAGLVFVDEDKWQFRENKDVHDRLYDSRAGIAAYYAYEVRDIRKLINETTPERNKILSKNNHAVKQLNSLPRIHVTVFDRIIQRTQEYSPGNMPTDFEIVGGNEDTAATFEFAKLYRRLGQQQNAAPPESTKILTWIRKKSAYITVGLQSIILLCFAIYIGFQGFSGSALFKTALLFSGVWLAIWLCVRAVQIKEKRHYSTLWRKMIGRIMFKADTSGF